MNKLDPFQAAGALFVEFALAGKLGSFDPTDLGRLQSAKQDMAQAQETPINVTIQEKGSKAPAAPAPKGGEAPILPK